jgi:hypothetical protein
MTEILDGCYRDIEKIPQEHYRNDIDMNKYIFNASVIMRMGPKHDIAVIF